MRDGRTWTRRPIESMTSLRPLGLPGLSGSIRRLNCHRWPSAVERSLKLINTPWHSPNDGQALPCLNSHSTHITILIACSIVCLVLPHHCPIYAPQSIDFRSLLLFLKGSCFFLSLSIQSWWNQPIFIHNSKLSPTSSHTFFCKNYLITSPPFPLYPNSIPVFILSYMHFFGNPPTSQAKGSWNVNDMAIHSPHNSPFTDLNTIWDFSFNTDFVQLHSQFPILLRLCPSKIWWNKNALEIFWIGEFSRSRNHSPFDWHWLYLQTHKSTPT